MTTDLTPDTAPPAEPTPATVVVRVENSYACGRENTVDVTVPAPADGVDIEQWWEDVVHDHTGDGHPCGASERALYEVTVVDGPADLLDETYSWEG